mgnify:CR=1 FL=1
MPPVPEDGLGQPAAETGPGSGEAAPDHGGRGVRVCERWSSFAAFVEDMAPRPEGAWLDRIDPNGNYEPGNVRWATSKEQGRNRRDLVLVDYQGETVCVAELAERAGLKYSTVRARIAMGWSIEQAIQPV